MTEAKENKVTIKIPRPLYRRIKVLIEGSGFDSPTDFIVYVLRDLVGDRERAGVPPSTPEPPGSPESPEASKELSPEEIRAIRKRLENLGYL